MDEISRQYISSVSLEHRKALGQFFTPHVIANLMVKWVIKDKPRYILDPAFGLGVFKYFIKKNLPSDFKFVGVDVDKNILSFLSLEKDPYTIIHANYLSWFNEDRFDAIICNPPYARFQNFRDRHEVIPILEKRLGRKISGYTNMASLFLLKSVNELNLYGSMAYIMPYEFFNTGYGKYVKESLVKNGLIKQIIIFENEKEIFGDATTTITVLLLKNDKLSQDVKITKIINFEDLENLNSFEDKFDYEIPISLLKPDKKWTTTINSLYENFRIPNSFIPLVNVGKFSRGIATGANSFFSLNKKEIALLGIPKENLVRCITKSPQLNQFMLDNKYFEVLIDKNNPVFCLDVNNAYDENTKRYIQAGENQGIHLRYLTKCRSPWYKIEKRRKAPILAGVFNRGRLKFIWNVTEAISFTCFHSFYPNNYGHKYLSQIYLYFISDLGQKVIKLNKRSYGANLYKFEPNDLNNTMIPSLKTLSLIDDEMAKKLIKKLDSEKNALEEVNNIFNSFDYSSNSQDNPNPSLEYSPVLNRQYTFSYKQRIFE